MDRRYSLLTVVILYLSLAILGSFAIIGLSSTTAFTLDVYNDYNESLLEEEINNRINEYRIDNGYDKLNREEFLDSGSDRKSNDMVENGYFGHQDPNNTYNYGECTSFSENIAKIPYKRVTVSDKTVITITANEEEFADEYIKEMVNSEEHKDNILSNWDHHGIGVEIDNNNNMYVTHHMCSEQ